MGIAGAGNSGTVFATLFAPRIAQLIGWRDVFGLAMVPVTLVWVLFFLLARNALVARPRRSWSDYGGLFKIPDTSWFCFLNCLTFGGFFGLASYLSIFFTISIR